METIFNQKCDGNLRLLVTGDPGQGKSLLVQKIALDWANEQNHIKNLDCFDIVIYIKLSGVKQDDTIYTYCKNEYFTSESEEITEKSFNNFVARSKCLIMLDGWDELSSETKQIRQLIEGKIYKTSTVLATSRPGVKDILTSFNVRYSISQLTEKQIEDFIDSYNRSIEFPNKHHHLKALIKTPLFLWYFVLFNENMTEDINSYTSLYREVTSSLFCRYKEEKKANEKQLDSSKKFLKKTAFDCLTRGLSSFEDSEIDENVLSLGIIGKKLSNRLRTKIEYIFHHKTLMEYLASEYIIESEESIEDLLPKIKECTDINKREHSLFIPFSLGLLKQRQNEIKFVFKEYVFGTSDEFALKCLYECESPPDLEWKQFFPDEITLNLNKAITYMIKGLQILMQQNYELKKIILQINARNANCSIDLKILDNVIEKAAWSKLYIIGDGNISHILNGLKYVEKLEVEK